MTSMAMVATIPVKVVEVASVTPTVRRFTLVHADGAALPRFSSGSHVLVSLKTDARILRNAYSLMGSPEETGSYQIAVRRLDGSRGGSAFLHEAVATGHVLEIGQPANLFPLAATAKKHILIAGGIGITPILAHMVDLARMRAPFELHYAVKSLAEGPFAAELTRLYPGHVRLYESATGRRLDPAALLADQPLGTHVYTCGPTALMDSVVKAARTHGWPERYVHLERFGAAATGKPFTVVLAKSGREIAVDSEVSLLEALEAAGLVLPCLCRGGACGQCETGLLAGEAEHRDFFLPADVKAGHKRIMVCVSRAQGDRLVLDL
jgi:ferredoxin-NADP reductase